jgi:hypothetical protein
MKAGKFVAILAAFLTVGFASHDARADSGDSGMHGGGTCNNWARISKNDATCLSAGWDNSPPASSGVVGGSTFWARNECSDYGEVRVHVDIAGNTDLHWHLDHSSKVSGEKWVNDVNHISCCVDKSDLCFKEEVEPITSGEHEGNIRLISVDGSSYWDGYGDVSTQSARYLLCEHWANIPYCRLDPEGDAFIHPDVIAAAAAAEVLASAPQEEVVLDPDTSSLADLRARPCGGAGEPRCGCGGHICDRGDCQWGFEQSHASIQPAGRYVDAPYCLRDSWSIRYDEAARECVINTLCQKDVDTNTIWYSLPWQRVTWRGRVWHADDARICWDSDNVISLTSLPHSGTCGE